MLSPTQAKQSHAQIDSSALPFICPPQIDSYCVYTAIQRILGDTTMQNIMASLSPSPHHYDRMLQMTGSGIPQIYLPMIGPMLCKTRQWPSDPTSAKILGDQIAFQTIKDRSPLTFIIPPTQTDIKSLKPRTMTADLLWLKIITRCLNQPQTTPKTFMLVVPIADRTSTNPNTASHHLRALAAMAYALTQITKKERPGFRVILSLVHTKPPLFSHIRKAISNPYSPMTHNTDLTRAVSGTTQTLKELVSDNPRFRHPEIISTSIRGRVKTYSFTSFLTKEHSNGMPLICAAQRAITESVMTSALSTQLT